MGIPLPCSFLPSWIAAHLQSKGLVLSIFRPMGTVPGSAGALLDKQKAGFSPVLTQRTAAEDTILQELGGQPAHSPHRVPSGGPPNLSHPHGHPMQDFCSGLQPQHLHPQAMQVSPGVTRSFRMGLQTKDKGFLLL